MSKSKDKTGMKSVPVVIALFNGNYGESPMRVETPVRAIWDKQRREIVFALADSDAWIVTSERIIEAMQYAFMQPSPIIDRIPKDKTWAPPGWNIE